MPAPRSAALFTEPGPLLQRDRELAALDGHLDEAIAGRGSLAVVAGPIGIGKTALLTAVRDLGRARGMTVLAARGAPLERDFGYAVVRRLFEPLGLETAAPAHPAVLTGAARLAMRAFATGAVDPPAGEDSAFATIHGLYWLTANLATRSPVLLVVDDCHWADVPSLRFLAYLAARLDELSVLLAVGVRSGEVATEPDLVAELLALARGTPVRPGPLDSAAASELVRAHVGADVDDALCLACHRATGGNPLLLLTLVHSFADAGWPADVTVERVAAFGAGEVARILARQLAHMPAGAPRIAAALAVLGAGAPLRHVAALAEVDPPTAASLIDAMRAAAILAPGPSTDFAHPVLRAAVADAMTPTERAGAHHRAARLLADDGAAAERRAVHLLHTVASGDQETVATLREAAGIATERGAPESAAAYLRRALDEPAVPAERGPLQLELGLALLASRRDPAAPELLRDAVFRTEPTDRLVTALRAARALGVAGYFEEAAALGFVLSGEETTGTAEVARLLEAEILAASWLVAARVPAALERVGRHAAATMPDDLGGRMLLVTLAHGTLAAAEPAAPAVQLLHKAFGSGDVLRQESLVNVFLAMDLIIGDELELAERVCSEIIREGQRRGSPSLVASFAFPRGLAALRRGALAEAEADTRWSFEQKVAMGPHHAPPWPLAFLVETLIARGDLDGAEAAMALAPPGAAPPETMGFALLLQARGRLRLAQGRPREALDDALDAGGRWERVACLSPSLATWRGDAARSLAILGERARARDLTAEQLALARRTGQPRVIGNALRDAAAVAPADRRLMLLDQAVELLRDGPARLDLAHTLGDLGTALRRAGRRTEAREPLRYALDLAHRAGAAPLADRAHAELVAAGARPRRHAATGLDALTASERRVASLAAEGMTNREIAERLFVTQRTVETHLQHAFHKLGVHRRDEIALIMTLTS